MRRLVGYLKPYALRMSFGLFIKTIGTLMDLAIPWLLAYIIDEVVPTEDMSQVLLYGGIMILCSVICVTFNIWANRMASRVACDCILEIRHDLFKKINTLSSRQVDSFTIASLESRLTSDTYNVNHVIGMMQRLGVRAPLLLFGGICVTLALDPVLTLVMLCTLPFIFAITYIISKKGIPLYKNVQKETDAYTKVVREDASGIRVIKALSKTGYEKDRFDKANVKEIQVEKKAGLTMAIINPAMTFFLNTGLAAVIVVGAHRVYNGLSGTGAIIAFMSYFVIISNALMSVSRMFIMYSKAAASMGRINEVLSEKPELFTEERANEIIFSENSRHFIEFKNVSFSYKDKKVIDNLSFTLEKGETLGIIGSTGSGKTTIINLLMRFYDPDDGEILIKGRNIKEIPTSKLRKMFGAVFQNDFLFADKISENIRFGRDDIDNDKIKKAMEMAQAKDFVESYDDKVEHMLEIKGANLSGGQKQRILISRALAQDPEILVLDDSSSALDYKTDALVRKAINSNFSKSTCVIVAQRVSSIMHSDLIIYLDSGKALGKGSHEYLLENCPEYAQTAESQMGGMIID